METKVQCRLRNNWNADILSIFISVHVKLKQIANTILVSWIEAKCTKNVRTNVNKKVPKHPWLSLNCETIFILRFACKCMEFYCLMHYLSSCLIANAHFSVDKLNELFPWSEITNQKQKEKEMLQSCFKLVDSICSLKMWDSIKNNGM